MGLSIVRYRTHPQEHAWAIVEGDRAKPLVGTFETTGALLEQAVPALRAGTLALGASTPLAGLALLTPVTHPCRVIAQAVNYPSHALESGLDAERASNILFRKSSASLSGPRDTIVCPPHVQLLDYEVELGLVVGARTRGPVIVEERDLAQYVGALVVANDVSARDVQIPDGQYYKGKSYRTFCPCGPWLYVPEPRELARWADLRLELRVNGAVRQSAACGQMIHHPAETLSEITTIEDLDPGDLVLTGTPGGVALQSPGVAKRAMAGLLPDALKWRLFVKSQAKRRDYLHAGDRVSANIRSSDGTVDLGTLENLVC